MPRLLLVLMMGAALLFFPAQGSGDDEKPIPCHLCCEKKLQQCKKNTSPWNVLSACNDMFENCLNDCTNRGQPAVNCSVQ